MGWIYLDGLGGMDGRMFVWTDGLWLKSGSLIDIYLARTGLSMSKRLIAERCTK